MLIFWVAVAGLLVGAAVGWFFVRRRPLAKLAIREADGIGVEFPIRARTITIGSEEGQSVTVSGSGVARLHATLSLEEGNFVLRDRSERGTCVNGRPVSAVTLRSGDLITLGGSIDLIFTRME